MIRLICLGLFSALLAGCAPATRVILLPQEGRQGAVEVGDLEADVSDRKP